MKKLLPLALALLLSGCGDEPAPVDNAPPAMAAKTPQDTVGDKIEKALLSNSAQQLNDDREALRQTRRGNSLQAAKWPGCNELKQGYPLLLTKTQTLVGVQEALNAAQVDEFVLCDEPGVFAATQAAAQNAVARLVSDVRPQEVMDYLTAHPSSKKMDECWLNALRKSRMEGAGYHEAYARAAARCEPAQSP